MTTGLGVRAPLIVALGAGLLVTLAYQRPVVYRVHPTEPGGPGYTDGFGAAGVTGALSWSRIGAASRVVFPQAGQIAPKARLRVRLGLPPESGPRLEKVVLMLRGERLAELEATPEFRLREVPIAGVLPEPGDWVLTLSAQNASDPKEAPRGAALVRAELVSEPPLLPPRRTLGLAVLGALALLSLLGGRLRTVAAAGLSLVASAGAALALAIARPETVPFIAPVVALVTIGALVDLGRRTGMVARLGTRLSTPAYNWTSGFVAPAVALGGLVLVALGASPAAGVLVTLLGISAWLLGPRAPAVASEPSLRFPSEEILVGIVTVLAFGFRLYHLEEIPFAIFRDEARHGLLALRLLADPDYRPLFIGPPINQPLPYFLGVAASFEIFGASLFSLRLVSALAGAAVVPLLWLLVREVVGPREGLLAALGLAVSSWHVSISRFAVNYVEPSLFSLPAYLLLWRGLRRGRTAEVAVAGLLVALGQYAAHTAKALLVVSAGLVLDEAVSRFRRRDTAGLKSVLKCAFAASVIGVIVLVPLVSYMRERPDAYLARAQQVSIWNPSLVPPQRGAIGLARNVTAYAAAFHVAGDRNGRHHLPGAPLLDPLSGLALVVGIAVVLTGLGSAAYRFLLLWLVAGLLPGLLTQDTPSALRTVEAAPAVYAIVAVGAAALGRRPTRGPGSAWWGVVAVALVGCVAWNGWTYFVRMYDSPAVWRRFAPIATHLGKRLRALRLEGALPDRTALLAPSSFLDDPDTRLVLQFYWPEGLEFRAFDGASGESLLPTDVVQALVLPNRRDFWALVASGEPRYAPDVAGADAVQEAWATTVAPLLRGPAIAGPPFPATARPTFWLYLPR